METEIELLVFLVLVSVTGALGGIFTYEAYREKVYDDYVFYVLYKKEYESQKARNALKCKSFIHWFFLYVVSSSIISMVIVTLIYG